MTNRATGPDTEKPALWVDGNIHAGELAPSSALLLLLDTLLKGYGDDPQITRCLDSDPHLGNYSVFSEKGKPAGINLMDYGCIRIFPPKFVGGVVDLYNGLRRNDDDLVVHAYETWGFRKMSRELIDTLNIWARFIYGPLMEDRVRSIADGVKPGEYGRKQAFTVQKELRRLGPVKVPREFVLMDRAAIGLGGVFLHLRAELNFHRMFEEAMADFSLKRVAERQAKALAKVGLEAS